MTKLERFIRRNFIVDENSAIHISAIVDEIQAEIDAGDYDDDGQGGISEYTLYEVFDEKLYARMGECVNA